METVTVKTSGDFMLIDIGQGVEINPGDTKEVVKTPTILGALEDGRLVEVDLTKKPTAKPNQGRAAEK